MSVTYYVVVPFDLDPEGNLTPGDAQEVPNSGLAERRARAVAAVHRGAVAFSRSGNPATGDFQDAVVLATFGQVDLDRVSE